MSDPNQADATSAATNDQNDDLDQGLGDKGRETLRKEREARRVAEEKATAATTRLAELEKAEAKRAKADKDAADQKAKDDGEWQRLATERDESLNAITGERDTYKAQIDAYQRAIGPVIEGRLKELTDADAETAKVFPKDADPLAQLDWLTSPLVRRVVDLAGQATAAVPRTSGAWVTPKPVGTNGAPSIEQTKNELAALRRQRIRS